MLKKDAVGLHICHRLPYNDGHEQITIVETVFDCLHLDGVLEVFCG